jgi:hypothetical protein
MEKISGFAFGEASMIFSTASAPASEFSAALSFSHLLPGLLQQSRHQSLKF